MNPTGFQSSPRERPLFGWVLLALLLFSTVPLPGEAADAPLIMGVFPRRNAETTVTMFSPLADYLEHRLGRPVTLVTTKDFTTFWKGVTEKRFDIVHFNQMHYIEAHDAFDYEVIVSNEEFGQKTLAGAIYVRKDSGITELSQLKGKKIVFGGGKKAMMSYVVPRFLLLEAGLKDGDFTEAIAINPPNSVLTVFYGQADAGGAGDVVIDLPQVHDRVDTSELLIVARSIPIKGLPWAVKGSLPQETQDRIRALFLALNDTAEGKEILEKATLTGFVAASDSDFDIHRTYIDAVAGQ